MCYGRGGTEPTTTDAFMLLGHIPEHLLGGEIPLDRTAAEAWRERGLLVPYAELPPPADDEVYLHELVGMRVVHRDGTEAGTVADLVELPQGLALDVRLAGTERTALVPYRPELVAGVDVPGRTVTLDVPEGLLE